MRQWRAVAGTAGIAPAPRASSTPPPRCAPNPNGWCGGMRWTACMPQLWLLGLPLRAAPLACGPPACPQSHSLHVTNRGAAAWLILLLQLAVQTGGKLMVGYTAECQVRHGIRSQSRVGRQMNMGVLVCSVSCMWYGMQLAATAGRHPALPPQLDRAFIMPAVPIAPSLVCSPGVLSGRGGGGDPRAGGGPLPTLPGKAQPSGSWRPAIRNGCGCCLSCLALLYNAGSGRLRHVTHGLHDGCASKADACSCVVDAAT